MLKSVQFGDARADGPHAPCGTRSTSRAASSESARRTAVAARRPGGRSVLTGPGPERGHNLTGSEHDLALEHRLGQPPRRRFQRDATDRRFRRWSGPIST